MVVKSLVLLIVVDKLGFVSTVLVVKESLCTQHTAVVVLLHGLLDDAASAT